MRFVIPEKVYAIIIVATLLLIPYILIFQTVLLDKTGTDHRPISYINKEVNLHSIGKIQEFGFKTHAKTKYYIDAKVIPSKSGEWYNDQIDGQFKILIFDEDHKLVKQICSGIGAYWNQDCTGHFYDGHEGLYIYMGELTLEKLSSYSIRIETVKGLSTFRDRKFKLSISPLEYNIKLQKRNNFIKVGLLMLLCFVSIISLRDKETRDKTLYTNH